jgi:hypothetical protein
MKPHRSACLWTLVALFATVATLVAGQWPTYPTPRVPRLPDGKPNLAAPAPRSSDGEPDLSGLWQADTSGAGAGVATNVAQDLAPGIVQPWALSVYQERLLSLGRDAPNARCLPASLPELNAFPPYFARIIQTPALIVITYQGETTDHFRNIYVDGRKLPEAPNPTWLGYSIAHWESDVLVVNSAGFNDRGWLDFSGHPQTESLRVTERFRRRDFGHLELEMILDDPKVFTKPVSIRIDKVLAADYEPVESVCEDEKDSERLVGGNGFRLSADNLSKYAGTYEFAPTQQALISLADGFLYLQAGTNGVKRVLVPQTETGFMFRDNGDALEFSRDSQGAIKQLVIHARGGDQIAVRQH